MLTLADTILIATESVRTSRALVAEAQAARAFARRTREELRQRVELARRLRAAVPDAHGEGESDRTG